MSSVAVVGPVLVNTGGLLVGVIVIVVVWVAHRFGVPRSQTWIDRTQLGNGIGPVGVKVRTPVAAPIEPPQV